MTITPPRKHTAVTDTNEGMPRSLSPVPPSGAARVPLPVMKASLFMELKRTIDVETVMQYINTDLTVQQQTDAAYKYFHGDGAVVSQLEKFMAEIRNYGNIWVTEDTEQHGPLQVIPGRLHRQSGKIYAAGKNVIGRNLERAAMSKQNR